MKKNLLIFVLHHGSTVLQALPLLQGHYEMYIFETTYNNDGLRDMSGMPECCEIDPQPVTYNYCEFFA